MKILESKCMETVLEKNKPKNEKKNEEEIHWWAMHRRCSVLDDVSMN